MPFSELAAEDLDALRRGIDNLGAHIGIIRGYGLPCVVSINAFPNDTDAELASALRILQHVDLIHPVPSAPQTEYAFKHTLTQEVAYSSQLQETRARKHAAVARALEAVHADRLGEVTALIAYHWEAANEPYQARQWRERAAS